MDWQVGYNNFICATTSTLTSPRSPPKLSSSRYKTSKLPSSAHRKTALMKTKPSLPRSLSKVSITSLKKVPKSRRKPRPKARKPRAGLPISKTTVFSSPSKRSTCCITWTNIKTTRHLSSSRPSTTEATPSTGRTLPSPEDLKGGPTTTPSRKKQLVTAISSPPPKPNPKISTRSQKRLKTRLPNL